MNETKLRLTDWDVREGLDEDGGTSWEVWAEGLFVIATVIGFGDETDEEYAKLIASAPELDARVAVLTEALERADMLLDALAIDGIKGWLKPGYLDSYAEVHMAIRAALAASGTGGENGDK